MTAVQGLIRCHMTEPEMILPLDVVTTPLDTAIFGLLRMHSDYFLSKLHPTENRRDFLNDFN